MAGSTKGLGYPKRNKQSGAEPSYEEGSAVDPFTKMMADLYDLLVPSAAAQNSIGDGTTAVKTPSGNAETSHDMPTLAPVVPEGPLPAPHYPTPSAPLVAPDENTYPMGATGVQPQPAPQPGIGQPPAMMQQPTQTTPAFDLASVFGSAFNGMGEPMPMPSPSPVRQANTPALMQPPAGMAPPAPQANPLFHAQPGEMANMPPEYSDFTGMHGSGPQQPDDMMTRMLAMLMSQHSGQ